jgi:Disulphide bond corrector protein DsbC/AhpC/TSA family
MTYDNPQILREFAQRFHVTYPLLADPESEVIGRFGLIDPDNSPANLLEDGKTGLAYPGFFYVTPNGTIKEKYFGEKYYDRFTANNVLVKMFPELLEASTTHAADAHLRVELKQSDRSAVIGSRVTLAVTVHLPKGVHVYAPGVKGYKPVQLTLQTEGLPLKDAVYPPSHSLTFGELHETVPVYTGTFDIRQDVLVLLDKNLRQEYLKFQGGRDSGTLVPIHGQLHYQACTDKVCYPPATLALEWMLRIHQMDNERSPEAIREHRQK